MDDLKTLSVEQVKILRRHLALVFKHEIDGPDPDGSLGVIHSGRPPHSPDDPGLIRC